MRRREFIAGLAGAAAWLGAKAQQPDRMRRIGMLVGLPEGDPEGEKWVQAFLRGMAQWDGGLERIFSLMSAGWLRTSTEHRHWQENWSKRNLT